MRRYLAAATIAAAGALALAACGSGDDDAGTANAAAVAGSTDAAADGTTTVTVVDVDGVGAVLADSTGNALYAADQESNGQVLCTDDACLSFWEPLEAGSDNPIGASGITGLGVVERPDGTMQATHDGRPLYTFALDEPGEVTGDGLSDEFGGQLFTWHAVSADGKAPGAATSTDGSSTGGISDSPSDDDLGY